MTFEQPLSKNTFGSPELPQGIVPEQGAGTWEHISQSITSESSRRSGQNIIKCEMRDQDWPGEARFDLEESIAKKLLKQGLRGDDLKEELKKIMEKKKRT
jgi:hypothetical protein